jgi:hypothetical protein
MRMIPSDHFNVRRNSFSFKHLISGSLSRVRITVIMVSFMGAAQEYHKPYGQHESSIVRISLNACAHAVA